MAVLALGQITLLHVGLVHARGLGDGVLEVLGQFFPDVEVYVDVGRRRRDDTRQENVLDDFLELVGIQDEDRINRPVHRAALEGNVLLGPGNHGRSGAKFLKNLGHHAPGTDFQALEIIDLADRLGGHEQIVAGGWMVMKCNPFSAYASPTSLPIPYWVQASQASSQVR